MKTIVGEKGGLIYSAASLADIAGFLEARAKVQRSLHSAAVGGSMTQREARTCLGQAMAYEDAARILRATVLVDEQTALMHAEFGFVAHERGLNLQAMTEEFMESRKEWEKEVGLR